MQRIFKVLFAKKPNCAIRAEAKPMGRSKKFLQQELHIVICNNFCLKKIFVQSIFKALFPQETELCIQGRGQTRGGNFAHMQSQPRFLSYKIAYQIWLSELNYSLSYSVHRQTDTHRRHAKHDFFGLRSPQNVEIHQNLEVGFLDQCNTLLRK